MNEKRTIPMIQIGSVIVSIDCLKEKFCCDLDVCNGQCCIDGDAGAPVTLDEVAEIEETLEEIQDELSPEARQIINRQGVAYTDSEGDLVTSIVNGKDCVFTCYDKAGCCFCTIEKAFREGRVGFQKPISCALYPIRVRELSGGLCALNYHRWDVCKAAVKKGEQEDLPVYRFLREPLVRRFGQAWYDELEEVAEALQSQGYLK